MHNKSILVVVSFVLSVGGWFLWNILLSCIYPDHAIYDVKGAFLHRFGRNALWWLVLVFSIVACVVLETAVASIRAAWFPTDVSLGAPRSSLPPPVSLWASFWPRPRVYADLFGVVRVVCRLICSRSTSRICRVASGSRRRRRASCSRAGTAATSARAPSFGGKTRCKSCSTGRESWRRAGQALRRARQRAAAGGLTTRRQAGPVLRR